MPQPTSYQKGTDFAADERNNVGGRGTARNDRIDAELSAVELTLEETLANLSLIQRDDGKLRDALVELYNLSATCRASLAIDITPRGLWATSVVYAVNDLIDQGGVAYLCATVHTSGVFATDYAAGKWQVFGSVTSASALSFTPPASMTSTNVQAAIEEVNTRSRNQAQPVLAALYGAL